MEPTEVSDRNELPETTLKAIEELSERHNYVSTPATESAKMLLQQNMQEAALNDPDFMEKIKLLDQANTALRIEEVDTSLISPGQPHVQDGGQFGDYVVTFDVRDFGTDGFSAVNSAIETVAQSMQNTLDKLGPDYKYRTGTQAFIDKMHSAVSPDEGGGVTTEPAHDSPTPDIMKL